MNEIRPDNKYPYWLGKWLLGDIKSPPPNGQITSFQRFCEIYPIADSTFMYTWSPYLGAGVMVIVRWFTRAVEDKLPYSPTYYLTISFNALGIFFYEPSTLTNTIQSFRTRILSGDELKNKFGSANKYTQTYWQTAIVDIADNSTSIIHTDDIYVVCFNAEGKTVFLPELD